MSLAVAGLGDKIRLQVVPHPKRRGVERLLVGPFPGKGRLWLARVAVDLPQGSCEGLRHRAEVRVSFRQRAGEQVSGLLLWVRPGWQLAGSSEARRGSHRKRQAELAIEQRCASGEGGPRTLIGLSTSSVGGDAVIPGPFALKLWRQPRRSPGLFRNRDAETAVRLLAEELALVQPAGSPRIAEGIKDGLIENYWEALMSNFEVVAGPAWGKIPRLPRAFSGDPNAPFVTDDLSSKMIVPHTKMANDGAWVGAYFLGEF